MFTCRRLALAALTATAAKKTDNPPGPPSGNDNRLACTVSARAETTRTPTPAPVTRQAIVGSTKDSVAAPHIRTSEVEPRSSTVAAMASPTIQSTAMNRIASQAR